jgi:hypothetical protein
MGEPRADLEALAATGLGTGRMAVPWPRRPLDGKLIY